ncbi:cobalamin biosynthesis protein CbiD [Hahella chejuensis KCTC 2396]|uniref:Cobalt-precorrin-5B C(1)-methyltransferase n=1 Tax=Hahella chejuensis (strain KCTC 2396) TaxID=349521 RepID=CBID_HAHCH|nr:cobalt-precorrin-5B (C(1))-methyltransferase [Hahella chejuensis]Q2S8B2.1 RecName: Full=Cobalt-precorrin-5B C(1)-methyltransferase; AltName: Full=Cobalt-precorrin-6A synthase [Hahella chejuensis KCTC 2396]ABC33112.1 cobalamin biosynthesis protein CbiD [Hahella chejuensis KCTC 2396]
MWRESPERQQPLRTGLTTGTCATACALAAARLLLTGKSCDECEVTLPKGRKVRLPIAECRRLDVYSAYAATVKDAGDDPDVTHGAQVFVIASLGTGAGEVRFSAADGVGTVTRDGLSLAVGEPAINPTPRRMIREHLLELADECAYNGAFDVAVGVENGAALAQKTMNPRLGIVGGLSILGTTGIVRPFSCSAYIASIHQGVDVARANGYDHIAACTGNASEDYARRHYDLPDMALIEMGDFAGALLKYLRRSPLRRLTIVGGFGKISKLACGHLDLHSKASEIDLDFIADAAGSLGATPNTLAAMRAANTSIEALRLAGDLPLGDLICRRAWEKAAYTMHNSMQLEVVAIDRQGLPVGAYAGEDL